MVTEPTLDRVSSSKKISSFEKMQQQMLEKNKLKFKLGGSNQKEQRNQEAFQSYGQTKKENSQKIYESLNRHLKDKFRLVIKWNFVGE